MAKDNNKPTRRKPTRRQNNKTKGPTPPPTTGGGDGNKKPQPAFTVVFADGTKYLVSEELQPKQQRTPGKSASKQMDKYLTRKGSRFNYQKIKNSE